MSKFTKTKEWLIEEYVIKNRPRKEIANECGLTEAGLKSTLAKFGIKKEKLDLPKEKLKELIDLKLNHKEIEDKLGIGQTTLYRYLKKYNLSILATPKEYSNYDDTNDLLITQLYMDGFSSTEIGKEFGISHITVLNHLKRCGVAIRTLSESQWNYNNKTIPKELLNYDNVYDLYVNKHLSKKDLGNMFSCDPCVIDRILKEFNIEIRNNSESKIGLFAGDKHWNWKGGITSLARRLREYFTVNQTLKILNRDGYKCCMCGSKKELHVHHIKPFKDILHNILESNPDLDPINDVNKLYDIAINDKDFRDLSNLITYCKECHFYKIHKYKKNSKADSKSCELLESCSHSEGMLISSEASIKEERSTTILERSTPKQVEAQDLVKSDDIV